MPEESINLDDLEDVNVAEPLEEDSAIIRCGRILRDKARANGVANLLMSGQTSNDTTVSVIVDDLLPEQKRYIDLISKGTPSSMACDMIGIDIYLPSLWKETVDKNGTYLQCMNILRDKQGDLLEEHIWDKALNDPKATLLKIVAIKSRKDEYKDNAAPQTNLQTNIHVSIRDANGNIIPFAVDTSIKQAEVIDNGKD